MRLILYPTPHLGRVNTVIYITKNYATKIETRYSKYNGLFKIQVFLCRDLLKGIAKGHICLVTMVISYIVIVLILTV